MVINITGFSSPHKDDVIDTNDLCDPTQCSYVEFSDCGGAILEEQPAKTAEAIRLFLQGLGYSKSLNNFLANLYLSFDYCLVPHMSIPKFSVANRITEQAAEYKRRNGPSSRVPRRASAPFDSVDSALYGNDLQGDEIDDNDPNYYGHELQLRVDSFDDRNIKL